MPLSLLAAARKGVRDALRAGAHQAEAFAASSHLFTEELERGSLKSGRTIVDGGVGIRAVVGGSIGFTYCNQLRPSTIGRAAAVATSQAKAGTPDPDFKTLPGGGSARRVEGLHDPAVASLNPSEVTDRILQALDTIPKDERIHSVNLTMHAGTEHSALVNSEGVEAGARETILVGTAEVVAQELGVASSTFDWTASRSLRGLTLDAMTTSAAEICLRGLRTTRVETQDMPLVLDPLATAILLGDATGAACSAEAIQRSHSYLAGRLGQEIGSRALTVVDDATLSGGLGSYAFDGEGVPGRRTVLVDRGVLRGFLHDSYTAGKEGVRSTGNAVRGGAGGHMASYRALPHIAPSNLIIQSGKGKVEDLVSTVRRGIYLRVTFDHPNLTTGEFSGLVSEGFTIEDGELGPAVRQTNVGFHLLGMMKDIQGVSRERRDVMGVKAPGLLIGSVKVAGGAA